MGEVVSSQRFKALQEERQAKKSAATKIRDTQRGFNYAIDAVITEWELHASRGTLAALFELRTNVVFSDVLTIEAVKQLELMVNLSPAIFAPNSMSANTGWIAGFCLDGINFATPQMISEVHARAFNVLLFLELSELKKVGVI